MFVVVVYTFFPLSAWSWFWSFLVLVLLAFAAAVVVGLEVEERTGTGQDKMGQARLLLFSGRNTHTNKNSSYKQCLALNPHPLRLELLAHVGYVFTIISSFLPPSMRHFMLYQPTITIKKRQAQPS
jgi:hypothetical protein